MLPTDLRKKIGLIFVGIERFMEFDALLRVDSFRIVSGSDIIESVFFGEVQKLIEFDLFIAENIGIRRSSLLIFVQKIGKNFVPVFLDEVGAQKRNIQ